MEESVTVINESNLDVLSKYPERPFVTTLPYGYQKKVGDPNLLVPDPAVIPLLDAALDKLDDGLTLQVVVEWLNQNHPRGQTISIPGIIKLRKYYRPDYKKKPSVLKPRKRVKVLTPEEIAEKKIKLQLAQERKKITHARKRQEKLEVELGIRKEVREEAKKPSLVLDLDYEAPEFKQIEERVVFKPNPGPQTVFFSAEEQEVLYGGAAGGGKTYALIADPIRYFDNKNFRGLILRRTNDELREIIWKSQELYTQIYPKTKDSPGAVWRSQDKEWWFPSGARLWMTYLERDDDVMRYHGQAFTYIGIDELTQYATPFAWNFMRSRLRDASNSLPLFMRATSNPGGPGHGWVKRMFVDPAVPGESFWAQDIDTGETITFPDNHPTRAGQPIFKRRFIPARVSDNPYIWANGNYEANLMALPEQQRRQLLEGDWSVADGAAFDEFRTNLHVVPTNYTIEPSWRKFRSCDFGMTQHTAVHWYAIRPSDGQLIVYREYYTNKRTATEIAKDILRLEAGDNIAYGVLDSSCWAQRGQSGPSIAEEMIKAGCRWRPSDRSAGSRIAGRNRIHELLRVDPRTGTPGLVFMENCRQIISDLPVIPADKDSDDIDPKYASDHAYDSLRYGVMSRPKPGELDWDSKPASSRRHTLSTISDKRFGY